jgi:hypothetical protein
MHGLLPRSLRRQVTRTWSAVNPSNVTSAAVQTITVMMDLEPPTLVGVPPDATVVFGTPAFAAALVDPVVTATDGDVTFDGKVRRARFGARPPPQAAGAGRGCLLEAGAGAVASGCSRLDHGRHGMGCLPALPCGVSRVRSPLAPFPPRRL